MVTKLAIQELPNNDCRFLRLVDNSSYNPTLPVENAIIEITLPGKDCGVFFEVEKHFNTVFNTQLLGVAKASSHSDLLALPDGVYKIKYSIKPNAIIYEEFELLRNCRQLNRYYKAVCGLFSNKYSMNKRDFENQKKELVWIKELIEAAKYNVEDCDKREYGLELFREANELLDTFESTCNTCR